MTRALLTNNALTTLSAAMAIGDTTFSVVDAAGFPGVTTASGNYFYCTLVDGVGIPEIVKVTNITGNLFTCTRSQDNTAARAFASGAAVSLRLTAAVLAELQDMASKDASSGYAGLTGFAINIWNSTKTFKSLLSFAGTANRWHVLPDKDGILAMTSDITGGASAASFTTLSASGLINGGYSLTADLGAVNDASDKPSDLFFSNPNSAVGSGAGVSFVRTWLNSYEVVLKGSAGASAIPVARFSPTVLTLPGSLTATGQVDAASARLHSGTVDGYVGPAVLGAGTFGIAAATGHPLNFGVSGAEVGRFDTAGNWLVGVASGVYSQISKSRAINAGNPIFSADGGNNYAFIAYSTSGFSPNAANAAIKFGHDTTGRSINAGGTINAAGADYAEYERNNGLTIAKGAIVGFKADGTLTNVYADAIRFAVKSTNPSYVGGDTWGSEEQVGKRPEEPQFTPAPYTGSQAPTAPTAPAPLAADATQEQIDVHAAAMAAYDAAKSSYDTALSTYTMDMAQYAASVEVAKSLFDTATYPEYLRAKAVFEATLEAARQLVDRIAYSGKVPCNVIGATPGGYIIASETGDGSIAGIFVADPDFTQYKKAVGRVNKIIDEAHARRLAQQINVVDWQQFVGRCEVAVIIH